MHFPKKKPRCSRPRCESVVMAKGLCEVHYHQARRHARLKNGSLVETPAGVLPEPHWEFAGDEASLIAADEKRTRENKSEENTNVRN
jgi:hypothetical protein